MLDFEVTRISTGPWRATRVLSVRLAVPIVLENASSAKPCTSLVGCPLSSKLLRTCWKMVALWPVSKRTVTCPAALPTYWQTVTGPLISSVGSPRSVPSAVLTSEAGASRQDGWELPPPPPPPPPATPVTGPVWEPLGLDLPPQAVI